MNPNQGYMVGGYLFQRTKKTSFLAQFCLFLFDRKGSELGDKISRMGLGFCGIYFPIGRTINFWQVEPMF